MNLPLERTLKYLAGLEGSLRKMRILCEHGFIYATLHIDTPDGPRVVLVDGDKNMLECVVYTASGDVVSRTPIQQ